MIGSQCGEGRKGRFLERVKRDTSLVNCWELGAGVSRGAGRSETRSFHAKIGLGMHVTMCKMWTPVKSWYEHTVYLYRSAATSPVALRISIDVQFAYRGLLAGETRKILMRVGLEPTQVSLLGVIAKVSLNLAP